MRRVVLLAMCAGLTMIGPAAVGATTTYTIKVTCDVPKHQPQRQLAPNSCLNYIPDGTQTYIAHVRDGNGRPVTGVSVRWTDSDSKDARFRVRQTPCRTASTGDCQAEVVDDHPRRGETVTVTATAGASSATGLLTFK